jgi:hypothetical protein
MLRAILVSVGAINVVGLVDTGGHNSAWLSHQQIPALSRWGSSANKRVKFHCIRSHGQWHHSSVEENWDYSHESTIRSSSIADRSTHSGAWV